MNIQKAIITLNRSQLCTEENHFLEGLNPLCVLIVTLVYLLFLLSLPVFRPELTIWYAVYPILMAPMTGISYGRLLRQSLWVLPLVACIGIFNPLFDQRVAFSTGSVDITMGWLSFLTIMLRGILAMQALLILIRITGFINICNSLRKMGLPKVLTLQLYLVYRYIGLLLEEADTMHRSLKSRGYGKKSFPLKLWMHFAGSLLIRSYERSRRIHYAMLSRGFSGEISMSTNLSWALKDLVFASVWVGIFIFFRWFDLTGLFSGSL